MTLDSEIWVFDSDGNKLRSIDVHRSNDYESKIVGIHWYSHNNALNGNLFGGGSSNKLFNRLNKTPSSTHTNNGHMSTSYTNTINKYRPSLCIAFENGIVHLKRDEDGEPIIVNTNITISSCRWNNSGSILAIQGFITRDEQKKANLLKFYNPYGHHLTTLKVPGDNISGLAWDATGLRLSLVVDSFIFFANIRMDYKWTYFGNTTVFSYNMKSLDRKNDY